MFLIIIILIVLISAIAGLSHSIYAVRFATSLMMWIALAESLNTITGYVGRVDFGHVMFFGVGAYIAAYLALQGYPWWLALILASIGAMFLALIIGLPTLRLHGAYFAIATWAFAEALRQIVLNSKFLGGSFGLAVPSPLSYSDILILMTITTLLALTINWAIERSRLGLAFNTIRNSELVASSFGVNVVRYRVLGYMLSAIPAGLAGALYAFWISYVYPDDVFYGLKTDQMYVMMLLGGAGSYVGTLIGSFIVVALYEVLWTAFSATFSVQLYLVVLGLLLIAIVVYMPEGIASYAGLKTYSARRLFASLMPPWLWQSSKNSEKNRSHTQSVVHHG